MESSRRVNIIPIALRSVEDVSCNRSNLDITNKPLSSITDLLTLDPLRLGVAVAGHKITFRLSIFVSINRIRASRIHMGR